MSSMLDEQIPQCLRTCLLVKLSTTSPCSFLVVALPLIQTLATAAMESSRRLHCLAETT